jgi:hypothetical protein
MSISEKKDGGGVSVFMNLERERPMWVKNIDKKYQGMFQEVPFWCFLCGFAAILLGMSIESSWRLVGGTFAVGSDCV